MSLLNELLNTASLDELKLQQGDRVLDVGSGLGQFSRAMARVVKPMGYVLGIERDSQQLTEAIREAQDDGEKSLVEFRQGDALKLPLRDEELRNFDVVHARFLLEHLRCPLDAVLEMTKAVRASGRIVLMDDDHANFHLYPEPTGFYSLWNAYIRSYDRLGNDPYIGRRLVSLLFKAGAKHIRNTCIFFGGCSGQPTFHSLVDNMIGVLEGSRETMISEKLIDEESFNEAIDNLKKWKVHDSAALWYPVCWAEGKW
ncbi:MAG: methyltransferase domain-containing protein [bacterium]|nr:MAG: methyltransferase domain-containing protein [bacterium]